jgi:glycosyltransferase involved in cell wall biosynthesis
MAEHVELLGNVNETDNRATPLLAICIPTHNRREVLEECLESILPQADALGVGVCVSDNGSSDGTWPALETLKRQYPWMQIVRHTRDIGFRDNLTAAVLSSRAQYVWALGDKLILLPGALEFMVAELVRLRPDAVVVNGWIHLVVSNDDSASNGERIYSTPQSCLAELGWWTTLIGATVMPRQAFVDVLHIRPLSREFSHVVALFSYLASLRAPRVLFADRVLIKCGKTAIENRVASSWADHWLETSSHKWYDAIMSLPALYSTNDKLQVIRSHSRLMGNLGFANLMFLRVQGQLTLQHLIADQVSLRAAVSAPWWSVVILSVAPRWMLRPLVWMWRAFLHVHPRRMLRAMGGRLRSLRGRQAHRSAR